MALKSLEKIRVLAVGAHPDDIELGAGGTIARHTMLGDEVYFLVLTYGEKSGKESIRKKEALTSARILNVDSVEFAQIPDTMVSDGLETILKIEEAIKRVKPDRVYAHCTRDTHQDHRNAALATFSAARDVLEVFSFESPDTFPNFNPQYYVKITDTLPQKIRALKAFGTQCHKTYLASKAIKGLAQFRGYQVGRHNLRVEYAEAFEVVRTVQL